MMIAPLHNASAADIMSPIFPHAQLESEYVYLSGILLKHMREPTSCQCKSLSNKLEAVRFFILQKI